MAEIRDIYGKTIYRIESDYINDIYGKTIYRIENDCINDIYGKTIYRIKGDCINDIYDKTIYRIKGDCINDIYGKTIYRIEGDSGSNSAIDEALAKRSESDDLGGCLAMMARFLFFIFKANWGGRVGIILGVLLTIYSFNTGIPVFNTIIFGVVAIFSFGIVGAIIGAIINFIIRRVKGGKKIVIALAVLTLLAGVVGVVQNSAKLGTGEKKTEELIEQPSFKTVKMPDGKTWMAENLNVETGNSTCYENNESKCKECGRLYDWATANTACPSGWHLPSNAEWEALGNAAGSPNFSTLPCGRYFEGKFLHYGALAMFWSATQSDANSAWGSGWDAKKENLDRGNLSKSYMRSVRCVRD